MDKHPNTISAFDAKNRLGRLLDRVVAGEALVITRHGEPVARLVPLEKPNDDLADKALATFKAVRATIAKSGAKVSQETVRSWKSEGRR